MENYSTFQFNGFKIIRSLIEHNNNISSKKISLSFAPNGIIDSKKNIFQLYLGVKIEDENQAFNIDIEAVAEYSFGNTENLDNLNDLFFVNAPALLFPYIRAYISTLTNLSGFEPITLPTLNLSKLGDDLKNNTSRI